MFGPLRRKQRPSQNTFSSQQRDRRRPAKWKPFVETLEGRDLPSAGAHPTFILATPHGGGAAPFSTSGPTGTTPTQIRHAYGFDQIALPNGAAADGSGQTIAIVDAYDDPNIANDLHQFDVRFGLPDPTFTKVNQNGGTNYPAADSGWASEIALDVEWAHAIAPRANILLVEASDSTYTNLFAAVDYAARQPGVSVVSMSWGGGEFPGESSYDSHFLTPSGHAGVTFVASSGDSGAPVSYPAASPNVLTVGGTTTSMDSAGNILGESGWSGSGGGISSAEAQPSYQNGIVTQSSSQRTNPDVAYDADPNTGFPVYDSFNNGVSSPWSQFGGTSDAAPQWAALIAIADQGRALNGLGSLDGRTQTLPKIYSVSASDFRDTTSGASFGSPAYSAVPGYDLVTGRGTPHANLLVADLIGGQASVPGATHLSMSAVSSTTAGAPFSITVSVLDANNNVFKGYTGTVHFTSSDGQAVLPANYSFTSADAGVHTFTSAATLRTAGSETLAATDTNSGSITGSTTVAVSPSAATHLVFGQQPSSATVGTVLTPAPTVRVLDAYNNLVTSDNSDQVTVRLGANPGGGTLSGATTVTVSGGVATFGNLSINAIGNGYTLTAGSGSLGGAASATFNVTPNNTVIEGFENGGSWNVANGYYATAYLATWAAHDGTYGLDQYNGQDWIYRSDAGAQVKRGDTVSVWLQFAGSADGRAYFGFGASSFGTLSLVAAPNTGQLVLQSNVGWSFSQLAAVNQSYLPNHWYRLEVDWGASGTVVGKLFDSNGTTLLNSVAASTGVITSGGIAFRAIGSDKYWDTVTAQYGVNTFASQNPTQPPAGGRNGWWGGWFGTSAGGYSGSSASSQAPAPWGAQSWLYQFAPALDLYFSGHAHNSSAAMDQWLAFLEWESMFA
jgi:hypothetical protein